MPDAVLRGHALVSGFNPAIDAGKWLIAEISHRLDGGGDFRTAMQMEVAN